jgi:hypothetical protein
VPQLEVIDQSWIAVDPGRIAAVVADSGRERDWWPDGALRVVEDRGREGVRWAIVEGSAVEGSVEIWLQARHDGAVLHYFIRADRVGGRWTSRDLARERRRHERRAKRVFWVVKDELEAATAGHTGRVT